MKKVSKEFAGKLKVIHPGLFCVYNRLLERFQVLYRDHRFGNKKSVRIIMTVEGKDGEYRDPGFDTIIWLSKNVAWDTLHNYPEAEAMARYFRDKKMAATMKSQQARTEYRKWWNKEHRKEWRLAFENAQRGIFGLPEVREKRLFLDLGGRNEAAQPNGLENRRNGGRENVLLPPVRGEGCVDRRTRGHSSQIIIP